MLTALVGSLLMSLLQDPIYEAEAQMLVEPRSGEAVFEQDPTLNVQNLERAIQTEIQVLEGQTGPRTGAGRPRARRAAAGGRRRGGRLDRRRVGARSAARIRVAAQQLADAYVQAYIATRREQAIDELDAAGDAAAGQDRRAADADRRSADATQRAPLVAQQATFKERLDQLQIDAALTTGGASVVKSAELPDRSGRAAAAAVGGARRRRSGCCSGSVPRSSSTTSTTRCGRTRTSRR